VRRIVEDPEINFTVSPERTFVYAEQLHSWALKNAPTAWKDYFFEEAYAQPGS
jgi:NitT/TauT family transport system substrate-binding protein